MRGSIGTAGDQVDDKGTFLVKDDLSTEMDGAFWEACFFRSGVGSSSISRGGTSERRSLFWRRTLK